MKLFFLLISSLVVFAFFLFPITDFDIWFHLADGKFIVENLKAPTTDIYSYTAYGEPAHTNSWGFAVFSYLTSKVAGLEGLNFIKALVSFLIFLVIIFYLQEKKLLNITSLMFVVLALFSIRENFSLRPHTFSYLIFVIFVFFLFKYQDFKKPKYILILTAIQFFWVNFHASFIWGIAFTSIVLLTELFKNRKLNKSDLILASSIFFVSLLNIFYGPSYLIRIVNGYLNSFNVPIREHLPPTPQTFLSLLGLVLISLFLVIYFSFKQKRFDIFLITLTMTAIGLTNARFLRDLVLFLCLTGPIYFSKLNFDKLKISPKVSFLTYIIILFALFLTTKNNKLGIGLGLEKFSYPVNAVEFIKKERLLEKTQGNLYNTYNFGGYLIWNLPEHKVFIDGRMEPYEKKVFEIYWNNFEGNEIWQQSQEKYKITAALMTLPHTDGKKVYNDSTKMFPKDKWALVYYDDVCVIYVRRLEALKDIIEKYEYKMLNPQAMDFSYFQQTIQNEEDFNKAIAEIKKGLEINPDSYRLHFTLSYFYSMANRQDLMIDELNKTLKINPWFKPAQNILNQYTNLE